MTLVSQGLFNREIADRLHVAESTIDNQIHSVLNKTDARCRTEAVMTMLSQGLIPCPRTCPYRQQHAHIVRWGGTA